MKGDYSKEKKRAPIVVAVILIAVIVLILCIRFLGQPYSENEQVTKEEPSVQQNADAEKIDLTVYAPTVQQYEKQYGQLTFYKGEYSTNYTGVFLLEPVDFDKDGIKELVIGYAIPHPNGPQYCTWPALDVWTVRDGEPVCLYEEAFVSTGDIVRQCGHVSLNGKDYIMTGHAGAGTDLKLLELKNGSFTEGAVLKMPEDPGDGPEYSWNGEAITQEQYHKLNDQIYDQNVYYASLSDDVSYISYTGEDMKEFLNQIRQEMGMDQIDPKTKIMPQL